MESAGPVAHELTPTTASRRDLERQAAIYRSGGTPLLTAGSSLLAMKVRPADAVTAGGHLRTILDRQGASAFDQSRRALQVTRGSEFAREAVEHGVPRGVPSPEGAGIDMKRVAADLRGSGPGSPLPSPVSARLSRATGHSLDHLRIHDDEASHRAADRVGARAMTVGGSIYFGKGEWAPATHEGSRLIAHEAVHALQQGTGSADPASLHMSDPFGADELEADGVARVIHQGGRADVTRVGGPRVQRALRFTHGNHTVNTNLITSDETATGFTLHANPRPAFDWQADITVHGNAGDPFANFEAGSLQVDRGFWLNVEWWGSPANATRWHANMPAPVRDSLHAGDIWTRSTAPDVTPTFAADGDVRTPEFTDTPATPEIPWANPVAGRVGGHQGDFNYGDTFVTYLGVRDRTQPVARPAFRILASRYWNQFCDGRWDDRRAVGHRVQFTAAPSVNHSGAIEGEPGDFPAMIGGQTANDTTTITTT